MLKWLFGKREPILPLPLTQGERIAKLEIDIKEERLELQLAQVKRQLREARLADIQAQTEALRIKRAERKNGDV